MGASKNPLKNATTPKLAEVVSEELDDAAAAKAARKAAKAARRADEEAQAAAEAEQAEAKAARKAAKRAAKEAAAATDAAETQQEATDEAAAKAARKAAKKARLEAEAAAEESPEEAAKRAKAEKKAAKKAALEAAAEQEKPAEEEAARAKAERKAAKKQAEMSGTEESAGEGSKKRKADSKPQDSPDGSDTTASDKQRKLEDGGKAASKVLSVEDFRKEHEIIACKSCPDPFQTFDDAAPAVGSVLMKALKDQGYKAPTPIQAQGWPIALQGKDVVGVAETGSGKTCGFLLPALVRLGERGPAGRPKKLSYYHSEPARPTILVLAPTRELAQQIAGEADKFAPVVKGRVVSIYGGVPKGDQVRELRQGADVLIATPGRLIDFATGDKAKNYTPSIDLSNVTYLVLDEADRMLDMGFEPDIRKIVDMCPKSGKPEEGGGATGPLSGSMRQTLFFTATWPKDVQKTAASLTSSDAVQVRIGQGRDGNTLSANSRVKQVVTVVEEYEKMTKLKEILTNELKKGETAIVFVAMKSTCDKVTWDLQQANLGFWCRTIHSGKDQWDRDESLAKFRELTAGSAKGERGVLVATDVASRGLDIPGVAMVVVYDFGRSLNSGQNGGVEAYVHRIGRTGRAGKTGKAFTFYTAEDHGAAELMELLKGANQEVPAGLEELSWVEADERWKKDGKKYFYRKGSKGKGKGKGKDKGKGKGKGKGKW